MKVLSVTAPCVAVAFYGFFMFTKHDPTVSAIIPFAFDPYDSAASFGMIAAGLLSLIALFRAFRPGGQESAAHRVLLARTIVSVALAALVPLAVDAVVMVRHASAWASSPAAAELVALVAGMALLALAPVVLVRREMRGDALSRVPHAARTAWLVASLGVLAVWLYPEHLTRSIPGELLSLAVGMVLVFVCQAVLTVAIVDRDPGEPQRGVAAGPLSRGWVQWGIVAALGLAVGSAVLLGETGGSAAGPRIVMVAAIFTGAGALGLLIGFYCLRKPLGLFRW